MRYIVIILTFAFAAKTVRCNPLPVINSKMSTKFTGINYMLNTKDTLYDIQKACTNIENEGKIFHYCSALIKENQNYITFTKILKDKVDEIQSILVKLLNLEKKAIICRGLRHLLPIIKYSIFINDILKRSSGTNDNSKSNNLKKKSIISIDEKSMIRSISNNNEHQENLKIDNFQNSGINQINNDASMLIGIIEKIKTIVNVIDNFIINKQTYFVNFSEISQIIMKIMSKNIDSCRTDLLLIHVKINNTYNIECVSGTNDTAFLRNYKKQINWTNNKIPQLVEEIDKLFMKVKADFKLLSIKFIPVNKQINEKFHMSTIFYHLFIKYHDPEVWELIGNEMIMDVNKFGSPKVMPLSDIIRGEENSITEITSKLSLILRNSIKCRCFIYIKLLLKLYYSTVRGLILNVEKIRLFINTKIIKNEQYRNYTEKVSKNNVNTMIRKELDDVFYFIYDQMPEYQVDGIHNSIFHDANDILLTIDEFNRQDTNIENGLKSIFVIYLKHIMYSMYEVIESITFYLMDMDIDVDLEMKYGSILYDIEKTSFNLNRKTVETLVKWYQWADRMSTNCFSDADYKYSQLNSTFSKTMLQVLFIYSKENRENNEMTLKWIIESIDELTNQLDRELSHVFEI